MQPAYKKLIEGALQILMIPAATYLSIESSSLLQHAGLVTLIIPDAIEASTFRYVLVMLYASLCLAAYLAASNREGSPDYLLLVGVLGAMPLLDLLHDTVVQTISTAAWGGTTALKVYLSLCISLPLLLLALCLGLRQARPATTESGITCGDSAISATASNGSN